MKFVVRLGIGRVRLMSVTGPGRLQRMHPRAPATVSPTRAVAEVLDAGPGAAVSEVVLVHPSHWTSAALRTAVAGFADTAPRVLNLTSAVCVVRELHAQQPLVPGPLAVLETTQTGVGVTVLADRAASDILAARFVERAEPLPTLLAGLLSSAAAAVGLTPAELTGGVLLSCIDVDGDGVGPARAVLVELADLIGEPPMVLPDPVAMSLRGALRDPPLIPRRTATHTPPPSPVVSPVVGRQRGLGRGLLGVPPPRRRLRPVLLGITVPALAALVTLLLVQWRTARFGPDTDAPVAAGRLAQYDYTFQLPSGWRHSGGLPQRRRTLLTPAGAPDSSDLISVEQAVLGYDSAAEPSRANQEFLHTYVRSRAEGATLDGLVLSTSVAGRDVVGYHQHQPVRGAEVDWYVLFLRDAQISVGCQYTPTGLDVVREACARVVGSLQSRR